MGSFWLWGWWFFLTLPDRLLWGWWFFLTLPDRLSCPLLIYMVHFEFEFTSLN
jgi:hypothetical protein